jgi:serine/threonine-protein kinase
MDSRGAATPAAIGRFRIDAVLGSGGMGSVYKAFDPTLQRTVAVKTVRPDIARPEFLHRLTREAQACARLRHPNIVTIYEAGEIDGLVYIVMEYLQGVDLGAALRAGDLSFEQRVRVLMQVLDALEHTHREAVIHRDIKPSNVHVQPDGSIKVVDFGLARMAEISPLTRSGDVMATPDYASPEQLRGDAVDRRTDIYSTGALAYEMFAGRRPFRSEGDTDSIGALVLRVITAPLPPMDVMWTRKFPEIERIVARAMAKDPGDRYQTAEDMRNALGAFLAGSHEAIAEMQAEVSARDRRTVIEARALIANGLPAQAETLLAETLQTNPDAGGVRKLLDETREARSLPEAGTPAPSTSPASQASTVAPGGFRSKLPWAIGVAAAAIVVLFLVLRPGSTKVSEPTTSGSPAHEPTAAAAPPATAAPTPDPTPTATPDATRASLTPAAPAPTIVAGPAAAPQPLASRELSARELFTAKPDAAGGRVNTGLRFRLLRRTADGQESEVDPAATTFHSGERVRFAFDSNIDGYLYVVQQGSSGRWTVLFPGARINGGKNAVKRAEQYDVPSGDWFKFDDNPGTEQIFVFLSRDAMEQLPGFDRPVTRTETIAGSVVEDLQRRIRSRDLVFEKASEGGESRGGQSQATYVVNKAEVGQAVAATITLNHQ